MEIKKSEKANLENRKMFYRELGLIIALVVVLAAFEWQTSEKAESVIQQEEAAPIEVEQVPVTTEAPPPPPEAPKVPVLSDMIEVVDDDIVVDTDLFISLEDDADMGVEIMDYVAEVVDEEIIEEAVPYQVVEERPTFNGGDPNVEFQKWIYQHITYPEVARENGISGRVFLQFTIEADGSITNVRVLRGVDPSLDQAAIDVVKKSPKWTPGRQRDKAVRVTFNFPIVFTLRN
ncbi:MAG TPA: energy transducer TonB [Candidatus Coprenecus stercoravium]|uniref:Energy transducer TonB n=1 Tax=Candidatus Coprenecus stercoravium TaxID=2840735 RepID=A0A9D2KA14_9BACT|nr:energy transducer TonB [Candidatus Coprenecus stercoravium]